MQSLTYPFIAERDEAGVFVITFPEVPEAISQAKGEEDILAQATDCLEEALAGYVTDRGKIPEPGPVTDTYRAATPGTQIAVKVRLYQTLHKSGITQAELARRASLAPSQVSRLLDPAIASDLDLIDRAFAALDRRLFVGVIPISARIASDETAKAQDTESLEETLATATRLLRLLRSEVARAGIKVEIDEDMTDEDLLDVPAFLRRK